jgi:hypothetical protein
MNKIVVVGTILLFIGVASSMGKIIEKKSAFFDLDSDVEKNLDFIKVLPSDLDCEGELCWVDVEPGATVTGSFEVSNVGEPLSELDWEIASWPEWGTWTFDPSNGTDLTPEDGEVTVDVEVIWPEEANGGEVKIVNCENPYDFCIISISLPTPQALPFFGTIEDLEVRNEPQHFMQLSSLFFFL